MRALVVQVALAALAEQWVPPRLAAVMAAAEAVAAQSVVAALRQPAAGYPEVVTVDQWLAVQFQLAVGPWLAGPVGPFVVAVVALALALVRGRRSAR